MYGTVRFNLFTASQNNEVKVVNRLIEAGAKVDLAKNGGLAPLLLMDTGGQRPRTHRHSAPQGRGGLTHLQPREPRAGVGRVCDPLGLVVYMK